MKRFLLLALLFISTFTNLNAQVKITISDPEMENEVTEPVFSERGSSEEPKPEFLPEYIGGKAALQKFIAENLHYPREAQENGVQGQVIISAIVEKDGSLSNISVLRSVDPYLDREAKRVVSLMPKFKPASHKDKDVRCRVEFRFPFRLV